jgi:uncharacterized damage-inducible protein DinB
MRSVQILAGAVVLAALTISSAPASAQAGADPTIASVKAIYESVKGYITKSAAQVPEDKYKYQPNKDVRTMGQLFGHIANASAMFCNTAGGMNAGGPAGDAEKMTTKADLQKALAAGFAACDHAFGMVTAKNANETIELFGAKHSRIGALAFNNAHLFEHYGNLVTYMRINGMVPPSSAGGGGN